MMFMLSTTLSLQLIALAAAAFLFSWGLHKEGGGTGVAKWIGFIATVIALFSLANSLYFATKFWHDEQNMRNSMHSPISMQGTDNLDKSVMDNTPSTKETKKK